MIKNSAKALNGYALDFGQVSPQRAAYDSSGSRSPSAPSDPLSGASLRRAVSFDLFDDLAARHKGMMGGASLRLALEILVQGGNDLPNNGSGYGSEE
jgi:hypothetical protein